MGCLPCLFQYHNCIDNNHRGLRCALCVWYNKEYCVFVFIEKGVSQLYTGLQWLAVVNERVIINVQTFLLSYDQMSWDLNYMNDLGLEGAKVTKALFNIQRSVNLHHS